MADYLYRVRITAYPNGACVSTLRFAPEANEWHWHDVPVAGWSPRGWTPSPRYRNTIGGDRFSWPDTSKVFRTRAAAVRRARLIESFGASVIIERSREIVWPEVPHMVGSRSAVIDAPSKRESTVP